MSSFFGYFSLDQKPADIAILEKMYAEVSDAVHESHQLRLEQNCGFGYLKTLNTPEAIFNKMLILTEVNGNNTLFIAEARLDNREELALSLKIDTAEMCDTEIILNAYKKWGQETPKYLLGDWSYVAYNFYERAFTAARDVSGFTNIYYTVFNNTFIFASSKKALAGFPGFIPKINEYYLLVGLTFMPWLEEDNQNMYLNIDMLKPGHSLVFENGQISTYQYWNAENLPEKKYKNQQDYAVEMHELMVEATKARLRSYKPVGSMLSGGLDSSTVSFLAADLLKTQNKRLRTYSHVPLYQIASNANDRANNDETDYIKDIVAASGNIDPLFLKSENLDPLQGMKMFTDISQMAVHGAGNMYWFIDIYKKMQEEGYGTLLSGEFGNNTISYAGLDYKLGFGHGSLTQNPKFYFKNIVVKHALKKHFPSIFQQLSKPFNAADFIKANNYFKTEILEKYKVYKKAASVNKFEKYYAKDRNFAIDFLELNHLRFECGGNLKNYFGIDYRDPCADQRVLEHALSIPNEAFFNEKGEGRNLVKTFMKGKIPDHVLFSTKKGIQSSDLEQRTHGIKDKVLNFHETLIPTKYYQQYFEKQKFIDAFEPNKIDMNANQLYKVLNAAYLAAQFE